MAPMVDIVFQLLIFFLVASEIKPVEADFTTNLPGEGEGDRDNPEETPEPARLVMDQRHGRLIVTLNLSRIVHEDPQLTDIAGINEIFQKLEARLKLSLKSSENLLYIINGSPNLEVKYVAKALDAGMKAGVAKITFGKPDSYLPVGRQMWRKHPG